MRVCVFATTIVVVFDCEGFSLRHALAFAAATGLQSFYKSRRAGGLGVIMEGPVETVVSHSLCLVNEA